MNCRFEIAGTVHLIEALSGSLGHSREIEHRFIVLRLRRPYRQFGPILLGEIGEYIDSECLKSGGKL